MALDVPTLKDAVLASLNAKVRDKNPELAAQLDAPENALNLDWLFEAVAEAVAEEVILHIQTNAEVAFEAGTITGADAPTGDTHDALIASGGTIT